MPKKISRATDGLLDELHGVQARSLLSELRRYQKEGESIPPALFAQINKFLKDNGVDRAVQPGDPTSLLEQELPEFDNIIHGDF